MDDNRCYDNRRWFVRRSGCKGVLRKVELVCLTKKEAESAAAKLERESGVPHTVTVAWVLESESAITSDAVANRLDWVFSDLQRLHESLGTARRTVGEPSKKILNRLIATLRELSEANSPAPNKSPNSTTPRHRGPLSVTGLPNIPAKADRSVKLPSPQDGVGGMRGPKKGGEKRDSNATPNSRPKLRLLTKRASSVTDEAGICSRCHHHTAPLRHFSRSTWGPVDLCERCLRRMGRKYSTRQWVTIVSGGRCSGK